MDWVMANVPARFALNGIVSRINESETPANVERGYPARRVVKCLVLTDGGGFAEFGVPLSDQSSFLGTYQAGDRISCFVDLSEGKGDRGDWYRFAFVA